MINKFIDRFSIETLNLPTLFFLGILRFENYYIKFDTNSHVSNISQKSKNREKNKEDRKKDKEQKKGWKEKIRNTIISKQNRASRHKSKPQFARRGVNRGH